LLHAHAARMGSRAPRSSTGRGRRTATALAGGVMDYVSTRTKTGAVRMVVGAKDELPLVVEATVIETDVATVKVRLVVLLGDAPAWEDVCNLVRDAARERVLKLLKKKKRITISPDALVALCQACRQAAMADSKP